MAVAKGMLAGMAGAAAYNIYKDSDGILSSKDLATGLYDAFNRRGAGSSQDLSRLQRNVDELQSALLKTLHDRQHPTVILAGNGRGGWSTATGVLVIVGGVAVYLRFVKGWRFSDLMYVTKASLQNMREQVTESITRVNEQLKQASKELIERLRNVTTKQEAMLEQQLAMDESLRHVGDDVAGVHDNVRLLQEQVGYSNQAITLLCGALGEVAKRCGINNGRYVRALDNLTRSVQIEGLDAPFVAGHLAGPAPAAEPALPRPNPAVFTLPGTPILPSANGTSSSSTSAPATPGAGAAADSSSRAARAQQRGAGLAGSHDFAAGLVQPPRVQRAETMPAGSSSGGGGSWFGLGGGSSDKKKP
jgi:hypothetical protein